MSKLLDILNKSVNYLTKKNIHNPRLETEKIFSQHLNIPRIMLYANFETELDDEQLSNIRNALNDLVNEQIKEHSFDEGNLSGFNKYQISENDKNYNNQNGLNIKNLIDKSSQYLMKNGIEESTLITELVFSHVLKIDRMMLFTRYKEQLSEKELLKIREYLRKIGKEKFPIQYLLNEQVFYGRNFYVNTGVLIPRQDTEILVSEAVTLLKKNKFQTVLDIGTGSGAIAITLSLEIENLKVMGIDISNKALEIANKNKQLLEAKNVKFKKSNLFENVSYDRFDMIISNPPYIDKSEVVDMSDDTLLHEPLEALFAEKDGLYFYYEITKNASNYLIDGGILMFEIGHKQGEIIKILMEQSGYKNVEIKKDLQGLDRVVIGVK